MRTIRHILLTTLVICHLGAFGQSTLQFVSKEWNFGSIREESGPIAHTFEATNRSEYPEVILDVTSTCGCTKPLFTRRPSGRAIRRPSRFGSIPPGNRA